MAEGPNPPAGKSTLGGGREIKARLLFVTNRAKLLRNIGDSEGKAAINAITDSGMKLLELPDAANDVQSAANSVRAELNANHYDGVVLIGGYDVVPSARLDVLDSKLRSTLENLRQVNQDSDQFIVWSDALYGDSDGDTLAELPVSRVPDGRRSDVLMSALQAPSPPNKVRGGVRNEYRPFAVPVYASISNSPSVKMLVSKPVSPETVTNVDFTGSAYLMLHGSNNDGTRFWGEDEPKSLIEAFDISNVPAKAPGAIVFAGCCWGALSVTPSAARLRINGEIRPRGPESSIAIAYLKAGALAFVGCTGTHYSPIKPYDGAGLNYFGKPIHDYFWANIKAGKGPAQALFDAKTEYAGKMPHGPDDPFSRAIEMKIVREFTILGLGW